MAIKEKVFPIYKIFWSFFVLQWIIHLFGLFCHIAHLVHPWIRNGQVKNADMLILTHQIYQLLYILYNGLALVISYVCALKMNAYIYDVTSEKCSKNNWMKPPKPKAKCSTV